MARPKGRCAFLLLFLALTLTSLAQAQAQKATNTIVFMTISEWRMMLSRFAKQ